MWLPGKLVELYTENRSEHLCNVCNNFLMWCILYSMLSEINYLSIYLSYNTEIWIINSMYPLPNDWCVHLMSSLGGIVFTWCKCKLKVNLKWQLWKPKKDYIVRVSYHVIYFASIHGKLPKSWWCFKNNLSSNVFILHGQETANNNILNIQKYMFANYLD